MAETPSVTIVPPSRELLEKIADTLRFVSADQVQKANSGHPGMPMGAAEIAAVLLTRLKIDFRDAKWINRDRFVLSAGHASALLYSMLCLQGFLTLDDLRDFRQLGSRTPGHPEMDATPGVDASTGPLGAGIGMATGMAAAERMLAETYNTPKFDVIDHFTYVLAGDGCLMEGVAYEAMSLAGHLGLGRLIVVYDSNRVSIDGGTDLTFGEDVGARAAAMGWRVWEVDGHNVEELGAALDQAREDLARPSLVIARTTIAKGCPNKAGKSSSHGAPIGIEELAAAKAGRGWPAEDFHIPAEVSDYFDVRRGEWLAMRQEWNQLFALYAKKHHALCRELQRILAGELPKQWKNAVAPFPIEKPLATRAAGNQVMNQLGAAIPELVGGSADLTPANLTEIKSGCNPDFINSGFFQGRNLHFGVREHAMGCFTNGLALHGGFIPYCATFLVFHDYMRPTLRLAALMRIRSIFVHTHDAFMVGEDGPTHQPVEQLASLRAIPRIQVWRPADANETIYAWQAALERKDGPTAICLSRQELPVLDRSSLAPARETLKGMYVLQPEGEEQAEILLIATGGDVPLALATAAALRERGRTTRVASAPCLEAFKLQAEGYRKKILPKRLRKRLVIEAGIVQGWEGILGDAGLFIGLDDFGHSGKPAELAEKLGFTVPAILAKIDSAGW
ncbi:MAG: transketolase [Planctomycetota bacterium]|jgi:transketolase|nr:transketolase [Planctomycetota bacterium]